MTSADVQAVVDELDGHRRKFEDFCRSLSAEEPSVRQRCLDV